MARKRGPRQSQNDLRASDEQLAADNEGLLSSGDVRTGFISGVTFEAKAVQYQAVDGLAIFEGCICLGTVEETRSWARRRIPRPKHRSRRRSKSWNSR